MTKKFKTEDEERAYYEQFSSEDEFLIWYKEKDIIKYSKPSVTVDNVIFSFDKEKERLQILLIERSTHPYQGYWGTPGGFVNQLETTEQACLRQIKTELGIDLREELMEQLYTFSEDNEDPRTWTVSVGYITFLKNPYDAIQHCGAEKHAWFYVEWIDGKLHLVSSDKRILPVNEHALAFRHDRVIKKAMERMAGKVDYDITSFLMLGETFTLRQARKLVASFKGIDYHQLDNSNFRKAYKHMLQEVGDSILGVGRPAKLYTVL